GRGIGFDTSGGGMLFPHDVFGGGEVIVGGGELEGGVSVVEIDEGLDGTLAEGTGSDEDRAAVIFQRAGDDFGGGGGVFVNQDDERDVRIRMVFSGLGGGNTVGGIGEGGGGGDGGGGGGGGDPGW